MGNALGSRWVVRRPWLAALLIATSIAAAVAVQHRIAHRESNPPPHAGGASIQAARVVDLGSGLQMVVLALLSPDAAGDVEGILDRLAPSQGTSDGEGAVSAQFGLFRKWAKPFIPVPMWYNPEDEPPGLAFEGFIEEALATWSEVPGQYFRFEYRGLTDRRLGGAANPCSLENPDVFDGQNTLSWARLPGGVLAVTCMLRQAGEPFDGRPGRMCRTIDDVCAVIEADVRFNVLVAWSTAEDTPPDMYDLRSNLLHELGHVVGLDHSSVGDPVMHPTLPAGKQRRALQPDDIAGVLALYAGELFEHTIRVPGIAAN